VVARKESDQSLKIIPDDPGLPAPKELPEISAVKVRKIISLNRFKQSTGTDT
jgi:hypothetical protein